MNYFAIRKCEVPAVFEITNAEMLKEHSRKFAAVSHWAFKENEREKALSWAGVTETTPGNQDAKYDFLTAKNPVKSELATPTIPVHQPVVAAPVRISETAAPVQHLLPTPAAPINEISAADAMRVHLFVEDSSDQYKSGIIGVFETLMQKGFSFVRVQLVTGESFWVVLGDVVYWSSNLFPAMFTPVYGGCDFYIRGKFGDMQHPWNDLSGLDQLLRANEGIELHNIVISSHRNLKKNESKHGLLSHVPGSKMQLFSSGFIMFDVVYGAYERVVSKDESHSLFDGAEVLSYEMKDPMSHYVLNTSQVVSVQPVVVPERIYNEMLLASYEHNKD